jgi:hypothetical protein
MLVAAELRSIHPDLWLAFDPVFDKNHYVKAVRKEILSSTGIKGLGPKNRAHVADLIQTTLFQGVNAFNVSHDDLIAAVECMGDFIHPNTSGKLILEFLGATYPAATGMRERSWKEFEFPQSARESWEVASLFHFRNRLENVVHHSFGDHSGCTPGCKGDASGWKDGKYLSKAENEDAFDALMAIVRHRGEIGKLHKVSFVFFLVFFFFADVRACQHHQKRRQSQVYHRAWWQRCHRWLPHHTLCSC